MELPADLCGRRQRCEGLAELADTPRQSPRLQRHNGHKAFARVASVRCHDGGQCFRALEVSLAHGLDDGVRGDSSLGRSQRANGRLAGIIAGELGHDEPMRDTRERGPKAEAN